MSYALIKAGKYAPLAVKYALKQCLAELEYKLDEVTVDA